MRARVAAVIVAMACIAFACGAEQAAAPPPAPQPEAPVAEAPPAAPPPLAFCAPFEASVPEAGADASVLDARPVSDADKVIAALRPHFRVCYQHGLDRDPKMEGRVVISASVDASGAVESVCRIRLADGAGLSPEVCACIADTIAHAHFSPPMSGHATINIPITFIQKKK